MRTLATLIAPLLLLAAGLAHAQYSWIDEKGVRQFSDRPPPPGTPAEKILKAPGKIMAAAPATSSAPGASAPATRVEPDPAAVARETAKFRHALQVMSAKDAVQPTAEEKAQRRTCVAARKWKSWLEEGGPLASRRDESGKYRQLTKEERDSELERTKAVLANCPAED